MSRIPGTRRGASLPPARAPCGHSPGRLHLLGPSRATALGAPHPRQPRHIPTSRFISSPARYVREEPFIRTAGCLRARPFAAKLKSPKFKFALCRLRSGPCCARAVPCPLAG